MISHMQNEKALEKLFELQVILDRLSQMDSSLYEVLSHDIEDAIKITNECIAELSQTEETLDN
jgi:hypothetical protein